MKKKYILGSIGLSLLLGGSLMTFACTQHSRTETEKSSEKSATRQYTCPMHPQIHMDHPGQCPICGMNLVPEEKRPEGQAPGSFLMTSEKQQLIGLKTDTARKEAAARDLRTSGRVAYDPELAAAQREYVEIARNVPSLKAAARSHLRLLGMSDEEILALTRKGADTSLYLPGNGDSVWVYATLYQGEMDLVRPGDTATIRLTSSSKESFEGIVRAVDPVINPMTRSARARIEVPGAGGTLRPDTFVNVALRLNLGEALTIPQSSLIDTGTRQVAFVVQEGGIFQPREVKTGPVTEDRVVITEGLSEGDTVVASATFLVDSESQLKGALANDQTHH